LNDRKDILLVQNKIISELLEHFAVAELRKNSSSKAD
jgi:hypothetical protein